MLDLRTFGGSKAAEHLVRRLNELDNSSVTRAVTNFLTCRNRLVKAISEMPDRSARITLAILLKDSINRHEIKDAPEIILTLTRNVALSAVKAQILCAPDYDPDDHNYRSTGSEFEFGDETDDNE